MSLPKALNYSAGAQTKQSAVAAVSSSYACKPITGTTWSPGSTISFDLGGCGTRSTWLDTSGTFLSFDVTATTTTAGTAACLAFDFIRSLTVYSSAGSFMLESITEYAAMHGAIRDLCSDRNNHLTSDMLMLGSDPLRSRVGRAQTIAVGAGTVIRFAIPLISILGTLTAGQCFLPIHALNNSLRIEIGLHSTANAFTIPTGSTAAGLAYTVTGATLHEQLITISDVAQSQIHSMCGGKYDFNSTVWRAHKNSIPAGQRTATFTIPARCDSVRTVLTCQLVSAHRETTAFLSNYARPKNNISTYQYRIGASYANPVPVDCVTGNALNAYMEARKCFGSAVSGESSPTLLTANDYAVDVSGALAPTLWGTMDFSKADAPSFLIALEAQPFSQNSGALISGTSTLANSIYLDVVYAADPVAADVISYVEADALFTIDANIGTFTVRF